MQSTFTYKTKKSSSLLAIIIWILTNILFSVGYNIELLNDSLNDAFQNFLKVLIFSSLFSIPILILLLFFIPMINRFNISFWQKYYCLVFVCLISTFSYGFVFSNLITYQSENNFQRLIQSTLSLFVPSIIAIALIHKK